MQIVKIGINIHFNNSEMASPNFFLQPEPEPYHGKQNPTGLFPVLNLFERILAKRRFLELILHFMVCKHHALYFQKSCDSKSWTYFH